MSKNKTFLEKFLSFFDWHIFPHPKEHIQSLYEIMFFIILFVILLVLYVKCNNIPFCTQKYRIECLDNRYDNSSLPNFKYIKPIAEINVCMPYSTVEPLIKLKYNTTYSSHKNRILTVTGYDNFSIKSFPEKVEDFKKIYDENQKKIKDYLRNNEICDFLAEQDDYYSENTFDSVLAICKTKPYDIASNPNYRRLFNKYKGTTYLYNVFDSLNQIHNIRNNRNAPLFYHKYEISARNPLRYKITRLKNIISGYSSDWKSVESWEPLSNSKRKTSFIREEENNNKIVNEDFSISSSMLSEFKDIKKVYIDDPGWSPLDDISQAYYNIKLESETIDSICLLIDFIGATEFSSMIPEPDEIGMSYIYYSDISKIKKIKVKGLTFHAQFKELTNRQNIRMFFLTSFMSGLGIIIVVFLIMSLYKIYKKTYDIVHKKENLTDDKANTEELDETDDNVNDEDAKESDDKANSEELDETDDNVNDEGAKESGDKANSEELDETDDNVNDEGAKESGDNVNDEEELNSKTDSTV